jgi:hypothetical protein
MVLPSVTVVFVPGAWRCSAGARLRRCAKRGILYKVNI